MQLNQMLLKVGSEFQQEKRGELANNNLARFLRGEAPDVAEKALAGKFSGLVFQGSPGQGNWAEVPWVACFYPVVTSSATRGYYVVYLFHAERPVVHLSLNQGTTAVVREFGSKAAFEVLRDRAAIVRHRVSDYAKHFDTGPIELGSKNTLPRGYESGHAFGKTYDLAKLPDNQKLVDDFQLICKAYLALQFRGGLGPSFDTVESEGDERSEGGTIEETKKYRTHKRIERNPQASRLAKKGRPAICEICDFSFSKVYGELGSGYIEAHHLIPLDHLEEGQSVKYQAEDFALLCANCHRMVHRLDDPSDLNSLKQTLKAGV